MAFQAKVLRLRGAQQVLVVAAVRLVAGCASLLEGRLVQMRFLELVSLVAMARKTCAYGIGLQESRALAGMRVMARNAVALGAWMLHLGAFDLLGLLVMAGDANCLCVRIRENDFAVFRRLMTAVAGVACERHVGKLLHQLRLRRLVRIMTLGARRGRKWLSVVRLDQLFVLRVVTIQAERGRSFRQVVIEFLFAGLADFVGHVTGIAAHVESCMAAAALRNIGALGMAGEAEILFRVAGGRFDQLKFIVRLVRIVALNAVAHGGGMYRALQVRGVFVGVAGDA